MNDQPTPRETQVLSFIRQYILAEGMAPTRQEIADHLKVESVGYVSNLLDNLEGKGLLVRDRYRARGIRPSEKGKAWLTSITTTAIPTPAGGCGN